LLGIVERGARLHVGFIRFDIDYAASEALVSTVGEAKHRNREGLNEAAKAGYGWNGAAGTGATKQEQTGPARRQWETHHVRHAAVFADEPARR
jgi:hypothetical protein